MNQAKTKLQLQVVDMKIDPVISASACLGLNLVNLKVNNDQENDEIHDIKMTNRKTNGDLFPKKKTLEDNFDTIGCLSGEQHLEVDKSIQPVHHMTWKIPVAMKEEKMKKTGLSRK